VLLHGLTGPIDGKTYDSLMVPMADQPTSGSLPCSSYIRTNFGNKAGLISAKDVARVRAESAARKQPWTMPELRAAIPQPLGNRDQWKLTASGGKNIGNAVDGDTETRFDTNAYQQPGMWLQIELPHPTVVSKVLLDTTLSADDYPRGYKVELSADGSQWSEPVATGKGSGPRTEIVFGAARAKFVRITQTGSAQGSYWSVHELQIYGK
jgi:hypothetical protein